MTIRRTLRSRVAALVGVIAINLLGISAPVTAFAVVPYQNCSASSPSPAGTAPCLFTGFEMDGDTAVNGGGVDWATNPFPYNRSDFTDLFSSTLDDGFVQGSDYLTQSQWVCTTHKSTPKDDLMGGSIAFGNASVGGQTHQIGYFQFSRVQGNGDTFVDFAFSKGTPPPEASANCPTLPLRQVGDIVITFVFTNGGGTNIIDAGSWNGTSFTSLPTGSLGTNFMAAFNGDGTYGEGALDMTATGVGPFTCHEFGSVYMDSHASGQNDANEMKDFISPELPPLCKTPTVSTQSTPTGSVVAGATAHDVATVTGVAGAGNPTGTVDFHLCGPLASATGCATGGTDVGLNLANPVVGTDLSGNPTVAYTSPTTSAINAIGTYCWRADYAAGNDTNYNNATGPIDAVHECFKVMGNTTTATASSVTGSQLPGVSATDTATVSLNTPATGTAPTGTVTFKLCDPSNACTQVGSPVALVSGSATSSAVSGSTSPSTLAIGKYCWKATYNPTDGGNYNGSDELSEPAAECFTTGKQPTTTTTGVQSQTVDVRSGAATVSDTSDTPVFVPSGATFSPGTVTYRLYGPSATANCSTKLVYTSSAIAGTYANGKVSTSLDPLKLADAGISSSGTYWWVATYSGDAYNNGSSSTCGSEAIQAVDAYITITPSSATNAVGAEHQFTITYTAIPAGTTPSGWAIAPVLSPTANLTTNSNTCLHPTVGTNSASCTYTINASQAGTYTLNATGEVTMGGLLVSRSTYANGDPGPGGSRGAVKHYVDGTISITPNTADNEVGHAHTFTITYTAIPDGAGAPTNFSILPVLSPQTNLTQNDTTCGSLTVVSTNVRSCTYTINSNTAGTYTLNATGSSTMDTATVTRTTVGGTGINGPATKNYVDATISITPTTATNVVGQAHVFTITLTAIPSGGLTPSGFSITPSLSSTTNLTENSNTCANLTVVSANVRRCTYTINSSAAGTYTLNASGSVTMGGVTVTRTTVGGTGINGPATKHYVDASLTITPNNAINQVGSPHVFTITLTAIPDDAGAPSGFSITPSLHPTDHLTQDTNTCDSLTVVSANVRKCTYTINSDTAGTYTLNAEGQVTIGGQTIHLTTVEGTGINGPATKHYVDASIAISPLQATNVVTHQHVFTITMTAIPDDAGAASNVVIEPTISPTTGLTTNTNTCAEPVVDGNVATCTYTINSSTEGTYTLNATGSVLIGGEGGVTVTRTTSPDGSKAGPDGTGPATKVYVAPNSSLVKAERDVTTPDLTQNSGGFTAGPIIANQGDVLEYRLTYSNTGKGAAGNVVVTDVVPTNHASYLAGSCAGGNSCAYDGTSHTLTWQLGNMAAGSSAVLTFRITLGTDFPVGVLTQVSNFGVVTTAEEGSKPSNTVVANVQPAQQVQAATVTLPQAGAPPTGQLNGWLLLGVASALLVSLVGAALLVYRGQVEVLTDEES